MIFVSPLSAVETVIDTHRPSRLISLLNPEEMIDTPAGVAPDRHLRLGMNDIAQPMLGLDAPTEVHVGNLLSFVKDWNGDGAMLVHCWAGVSRSTAAAFISLCVLNDTVPEQDLAARLRQAAAHASPNRLLVALADDLLGRQGRMVDAIDAMGPATMVWEGKVFELPARVVPKTVD